MVPNIFLIDLSNSKYLANKVAGTTVVQDTSICSRQKRKNLELIKLWHFLRKLCYIPTLHCSTPGSSSDLGLKIA